MSKKRSKDMVVPLRVPEEIRTRVKEAAALSKLSEADIMRLSIERGIAAVEKMFEAPETQAA